ncbi:MAG: hypothetical protein K6T91_06225 [Firmicutes bacterium]|nr:hypothetical protein [Bacillota bacterium]
MEVSTLFILFLIGFFIGLFSRLIYALMTGKFPAGNLKTVNKVRYISPKVDIYEESENEQNESSQDKKAANQ